MQIDSLISGYGLLAIFAGCFFEGETVAITGGVMAHHHLLVPWQVTVTAAVAVFMADSTVFLMGRRFGNHSTVQRILTRPGVIRAMDRLSRHPGRFAFGLRFVPGLRIAGPIALAQSRMTTPHYIAIAAVAAALWSTLYTTLGHLAGEVLQRIGGGAHRIEFVLILAAAVLGALALHALRKARA